ncbi:PIG-L deacetylase family protein [Pseudohoeflea coraliihabitans]|uniref:PIG-L family deacetylase n=1 Tax=Pseudohoeflea coraliihabitans TaxID=2860393 RepID=A0ABS6WLN8_9HYPH|nr:PIG-L family deacetylase [Pseudohoeflea sp. DP4N28-3]MBW3096881.1 PIG-L family deacetylase [Pseudohoeflea sp. DP4N28-3]
MPTDQRSPVIAVLLAHQDDELGICETLFQATRSGKRCLIFYLTSGVAQSETAERRNRESQAVLEQLGVPQDQVFFCGDQLGISDGTLPAHMDIAYQAVHRRLSEEDGPLEQIVCHAWEGGHQDHDAVHVISVLLAERFNIVETSRQFSLYRAARSPLIPYLALSPLRMNGPALSLTVPRRRGLSHLAKMFTYRSQIKVMLLLFPSFAHRYLWQGREQLQPLQRQRINEPPTPWPALYERRRSCRYEELAAFTRQLVMKQRI